MPARSLSPPRHTRWNVAFKKHIVVISGSGSTGLVKLSGSFDGLNKVKGECRCDCAESGSRLYIIADEVTEIKVDGTKTVFEVPVAAKSDVYCLLVTGGRTLTGSSGGRVDRRQLEGRIELYKREKLRAAREKRAAAVYVPGAEPSAAAASPAAEDGRDVRADDGGIEPGTTASPAAGVADAVQSAGGADGGRAAPPAREAAALRTPPEAPFSPSNADGTAGVLRNGVRYDGTNFYQSVKPQIDDMFVRYPAEQRLSALVPNSKWVRVDVDADDYYVVGVLFDLSLPIFVCYGIPGVRSVPPPAEIADASVWLPLDPARPEGEGFWVIYQSATDGKCIR